MGQIPIGQVIDQVVAQSPPQQIPQPTDENLFSLKTIAKVAFYGAIVWAGSKAASHAYKGVFGGKKQNASRRRLPKEAVSLRSHDEDAPGEDDEDE